MKVTIYHNPRCSKSRQTLSLLHENGIEPELVEYLNTPPTKKAFKAILKMLGKSARQLLRKNEMEYADLGLGNIELSEDELIEAMLKNPKLIERPIVVVDDKKAVIGRPPEAVLTLLK